MAEPVEPRTFSVDQLPDGGRHGLRRDQLAAWLLDTGLARPNGTPDTLELTAYGFEVAAGVHQLRAWIRT